MPLLRIYDLMISDAWRYGDDYHRFVEMLHAARHFEWRNFSIPEDDPIHSTSEPRVGRALAEQVRRSQAVLMLGGLYATHSDWLHREVDMAEGYGEADHRPQAAGQRAHVERRADAASRDRHLEPGLDRGRDSAARPIA